MKYIALASYTQIHMASIIANNEGGGGSPGQQVFRHFFGVEKTILSSLGLGNIFHDAAERGKKIRAPPPPLFPPGYEKL